MISLILSNITQYYFLTYGTKAVFLLNHSDVIGTEISQKCDE